MSCIPGRTPQEQRLLRALAHAVRRNHDLNPGACRGCREVCAFLTVPGYNGDVDHPPCIGVYGADALAKLGQMKGSQTGDAR